VRGDVVDQVIFQIFVMSIRSGGIHDQSRMLSEITPNFGRFLTSQILLGHPSKSCTVIVTLASRHIPGSGATNSKVISSHMLNFKPNYTFLCCVVASLGQSVARVKI